MYQPYLIAKFATGLDREVEPWMLPDEAQQDLFDGFAYRGILTKRFGYEGFATGLLGISPSRVVDSLGAYPGNPVMMLAVYYAADNSKVLVVADTQFVNIYNPATKLLEFIASATTPYTGTSSDFFDWVNYPDSTNNNRLLFTNNVNPIQNYTGAAVIDYVFTLTGVTVLTCLLIFQLKDRLILLRTREDGTIFPRRIRISGTGADCDNFDTTATGAGVIDIPDDSWIMSATPNRDDLLIFTENSTWILKYTGNDVTPFVLDRIDESRGSQAPFSGITYLNRSTTASTRGLIISDGYRVERADIKIPFYSIDDIDQENFQLCFAGSVDEDRDHYLIHPSPGEDASDRILVTNYEEDNYAVYRLPLSCMGNYISQAGVTWNDLSIYNDWAHLSSVYNNWDAFAFSAGSPFSLGGGHQGEVWQLNIEGNEDNLLYISAIAYTGAGLPSEILVTLVTGQVHNYVVGDYIFFDGVVGIPGINNKQYAVTSTPTSSTFTVQTDLMSQPVYVSGGQVQRVIPFEFKTKRFNPFSMNDQKVRCGWIYFYVNSSETKLTRNILMSAATKADPCVITTSSAHHLTTGDFVAISEVVGMTELNDNQYVVNVLTDFTFELVGIDSSGFTDYVSGGLIQAKVQCILNIDVLTNDNEEITQLDQFNLAPYQANCTNLVTESGVKKWYKLWINQTARFIQLRIRNQQAGAQIDIQAIMPGFAPAGRLI